VCFCFLVLTVVVSIKANAYGHGVGIVGRKLVTLGYTVLCVAHVKEAKELMQEAPKVESIIILTGPLVAEVDEIAANAGVMQPVVCTKEMIEALDAAGKVHGQKVSLHIKIDTGMHRFGCLPEELQGLVEVCQQCPHIILKGIMSHFACADSDAEVTARQVKALVLCFLISARNTIVVFYLLLFSKSFLGGFVSRSGRQSFCSSSGSAASV
jgi:alanine racemase